MGSALRNVLTGWKGTLLQEMVGLDTTIIDLFDLMEYGLVHHVLRGTTLLGAPGIGKSFLVGKISASAPIECQLINCGSLLIQGTSETLEAELQTLFYPLEDALKGCPQLIILDDLDLLTSNAGSRALGLITRWLSAPHDPSSRLGSTMILGVTSCPSSIPPSWKVSGRLSGRVEMRENSHLRRSTILFEFLQRFGLAPDLPLRSLADKIASVTPSLTPGDLKALIYKVLARDGRLIVKSGGEACDGTLQPHPISLDKLESLFVNALKSFVPAGLKAGLNQIGRSKQLTLAGRAISLSDVFGLDEIIAELQRSLITPLRQHSSGVANPLSVPRGILLHGPPGVGKTLLCHALCEVMDGNLVFVESTSLRSSYVGDSEKAIAAMFEQARQNAPCILCLDQLDALLPPRSTLASQEGSAERIVTSFLTELDGLFAHEGGPVVVLLGVTNRPTWIDPAILRPGRLDIHLPIPLPNLSQRVSIFRGKLGPRHNLSDLQLGRLASLTEGFSGADLENICQGAALSTLRSNPEASEVNGLRYIYALGCL